jgi:hypothetical protein
VAAFHLGFARRASQRWDVTTREPEPLLQTVADALQCPMPPWVEWETPAQA